MSLANTIAKALLKGLSDRQFIKLQFLYWQGALPNLREPRTFNEKIQWLKLNYRNQLLVQCADKLAVRDYVRSIGLDDILIPLLGVYDSAREIPYERLPDRFVLKATHGSGWNVLCRSQSSLDVPSVGRRFSKWLDTDFYQIGREWAYRGIPPRIICEGFISGADGEPPPDFKVFCFHGEPKYVQVDCGRFENHTRNIYDVEWNLLPMQLEYRNEPELIPVPWNLKTLLDAARRLSAPFPFVRVDLYTIEGKVFFGELTFYPGKGVERFSPGRFDTMFGGHLMMDRMREFIW